MEDKIVSKFINKVKDKLSKNKTTSKTENEYAFSTKEIECISEQNKQKIKELKQDLYPHKEKKTLKNNVSKIIDNKDTSKPLTDNNIKPQSTEEEKANAKEEMNSTPPKEEVLPENPKETIPNELDDNNSNNKDSFINLSSESQKIIMTKWNSIDSANIDKDIMTGKDLLNHNYTITYADEAAKFIHHIRKEYEVVICYLIGFNNEKKEIYNKTIFSDKIEEEWHYLNQYIKLLEKIRNNKK